MNKNKLLFSNENNISLKSDWRKPRDKIKISSDENVSFASHNITMILSEHHQSIVMPIIITLGYTCKQ